MPKRAKQRDEFLEKLPERIGDATNLLIGGDFNCVENLTLDGTGFTANMKNASKPYLEQLRAKLDIKDTYRAFHSNGKETTYFNKPFKIGTRPDRIYLSTNLLPGVKDPKHLAFPRCNH